MSKRKIKVAVQMDKLNKINKDTDTTLALIQEGIKRKFSIFIYNVDNLYFENNELKALANKVLSVNFQKEKFLTLGTPHVIILKSFEFILIRQDPPFNMEYITATYLLERLPASCTVLNKPKSIRDCPEKLFVMDFSNLMPPTLISKQKSNIIKFVNKFKKVVIKPIYGNGGSNVFYLNEKDPNLNIIIDSLISETEHVIVQKFIKNVKKGDKRILLINGLPVGAVNRVPLNNEIRANLHIGGRAKKTNLTKREKFICNQIKSKLREKGLFFTGIDVIDGYLTEINVTSPTCVREIDALNKVNISYIYWEEALQLRNHRTSILPS
ncbi:MAG: glutathione synthase [Pseudomonadota bacterium]|nr:glutathione synthase [Pseudomonadota bacterium]